MSSLHCKNFLSNSSIIYDNFLDDLARVVFWFWEYRLEGFVVGFLMIALLGVCGGKWAMRVWL